MDNSSQAACNGSAGSQGVGASSQLGQVQHSSQGIIAYTAAVSNGDAPVTTLLQLHSLAAELAIRRAKVNREVEDALAKLNMGVNQYVSFYY
ncbi:hypothetical protein F5Y11DRAFT_353785 [Daldinia sp. FL1419]|nr:hypothetical protein F5Y11DRAFT_353785 [Daldinia sp. FL1419]